MSDYEFMSVFLIRFVYFQIKTVYSVRDNLFLFTEIRKFWFLTQYLNH